MNRSSVITVLPTELAVSIDELKARLRYTANDFDSEFKRFVNSAIEYCQDYQWAQYCTATVIDRFDRFYPCLTLLRNPVISVTTVQYVDTGGTTRTLIADTDYTVDISLKPCRIVPAYTKYWPATRGHLNDVTVTYQAGYGAASDVPDDIKDAILMQAGGRFEACDMSLLMKSINCMLDKKSFRVFY